jgi:hypothetical protein
VSLAPSSERRSTSPPLLLPPSAVDGVVRRSAIGGACWMPCECSIKRSASSSSSLDRSLDKRGPATGDGASVVDARLDMMGDGLDGQTCPGQNAQHVLRASEVRAKESRQADVSGSARLDAAYLGYRRPTTWGRWMLFLGDVIIKYQVYKSAELVNHQLLETCRDGRIVSLVCVRPRMSALPATPRKQQESPSTRSRLMTIAVLSLASPVWRSSVLQC